MVSSVSEKPAVSIFILPTEKMGDIMFFRNVGNHLPDYLISYSGHPQSEFSFGINRGCRNECNFIARNDMQEKNNIFSEVSFQQRIIFLQYVNVKVIEVCKEAENAFGTYVYSTAVRRPIILHIDAESFLDHMESDQCLARCKFER
jgi:hypothetical protein